ncbi:hypothetical protein M409DRAFT_20208 [Zasmidium cellare ATCC 36951]|uniref:NmrA-like domain-containing protein n=1 Tax=Zasmidium cellare ATCC 36951 TaxID=1080233 RepID=A0A6A6CSW3_ZASCE|nr:uncharacterized protein M409DRAFT_20208 [Zasmidium cellare ATCC 36951]KAF2169793.1 hypothetical protein M409DRAFT_20208 [Zasmidium cellare ATCC 36951]
MPPIVVVTSPSGKIATHLLPLLAQNNTYTLRLAAHTQSSASTLQKTYPTAEIVPTDLTSPSSCTSLLKDATAAIHIGPSLHSREKEIGLNMVDAAVAETQRPGAVFTHFIFSSVLNTQHRQLMQHDLKSYIEERLMISPASLNWTILKPTNFLDAYPVQLLAGMETPAIERLWTPEVPSSVIALRDIAAAIERVLREGERHYYAEYPLCGTLPVSDREIIETIGRVIEKDVEIRQPTFEGGVERLMFFLFGEGRGGDFGGSAEGDWRGDICRDGAERLVLFYRRRGLKGSPNILRWLLGREPVGVEEWVRGELREGVALRTAAGTGSKIGGR